MYHVNICYIKDIRYFDIELEKHVNDYVRLCPGVELITMCTGSSPQEFIFTWKLK